MTVSWIQSLDTICRVVMGTTCSFRNTSVRVKEFVRALISREDFPLEFFRKHGVTTCLGIERDPYDVTTFYDLKSKVFETSKKDLETLFCLNPLPKSKSERPANFSKAKLLQYTQRVRNK